jgi:uncharacterized OsmC-like protein
MNEANRIHVADTMGRMRKLFEQRPAAARVEGSPATAVMGEGMVCEVSGPKGEHIRCDLSPAAGGDGTAPGPAWYLRASMAACTAMLLQQRAAELGIRIEGLSVHVEGSLYLRGAFGFPDAERRLQDLRMTISIQASPADHERAQAAARWAAEHSPTVATVRQGVACEVRVEPLR